MQAISDMRFGNCELPDTEHLRSLSGCLLNFGIENNFPPVVLLQYLVLNRTALSFAQRRHVRCIQNFKQ